MLFGREFSRKQVCVAGAGILCAALLIGGGAYAISHASWTGDSNAPAVSQSKDDEKQDMVLTLEVKADGWDADTSTPIIAHIEDADGEVDFYTAIAANKQVTVEIGESGTYSVTLIPPVNADGSTYKAASSKVKAGKDDKKTNGTVITLEKVDAGKLTKDDLTAIAKDVAAAVKKGDSTLTGDRGVRVVNIFQTNIGSNPNADTDAVEKETGKAEETAKEEKPDAKTPETTGGKGDDGKTDSKPSGGNSSNSGSNTNSGGSSKKDDAPAHQHNWVAQTKTVHHDAQYKTVHHDAVTHQVWHDPVTEEHYICNQCGADITSDPWGHINNSLMNGGNCGSYHSIYVTVKQGYSETVTDEAAWDEQVLVSKAWDETVTTGYKCSSCGATKWRPPPNSEAERLYARLKSGGGKRINLKTRRPRAVSGKVPRGSSPLERKGARMMRGVPKKTGVYVPLIRPHSFGEAHSPPVIYTARPPSQSMLSTSPNPMQTAAPPQSPSSSVLTCLPPFRAHGP